MITKTFTLKAQEQKETFVLTSNQKALLFTVGDVHFLDPAFPATCFLETLHWAMDRGCYFLGLGDFIDFTSYSQRKLIMPMRDNTRKQIDVMIRESVDKFIELIGFTKGRWIGMLEGNHTWDYSDGTSVDQQICCEMNCNFLGTMALIRLLPSDMPSGHYEAGCTICAHHGIGSARTAGGHFHRVEDLLKWNEADIYIMGHSHSKGALPIDEQCLSPDGVHYHRTKLIVRSGSWLKGYQSHEPLDLDEPAFMSRGSYVEQKAYMPSAIGGVCLGIGYEKIHKSKYYRPTIHFSI